MVSKNGRKKIKIILFANIEFADHPYLCTVNQKTSANEEGKQHQREHDQNE